MESLSFYCGFEGDQGTCDLKRIEGPFGGFNVGTETPTEGTGPSKEYGARGTSNKAQKALFFFKILVYLLL